MKFVFLNQCELCADTITDILKSEGISYRIKSYDREPFGQIFYDITIDTSFEHWLFVQKIAIDKLMPYMRAEKSYMLPSYSPKVKTLNVEPQTPLYLINKLQKENDYEFELVVKKKSLLKKLVDKIKEIL